ncbi:MAG: AbrB family transcriptional regulator [Eubacteriales bacterium]
MIFCKENKSTRIFLTIVIGITGGFLFTFIHMPMPWMLGPMLALLIASNVIKIPLYWPTNLRNWSLIIIGYNSGQALTNEALVQIFHQLPWMLILTIILITFCAASAFLVCKFAHIDYLSTLMGAIPGGLSQMVLLGEEIESADLTVITLLQITRLMMIIFCIPMIAYSSLFSPGISANTASIINPVVIPLHILLGKLLLFAVISTLCAFLAKKIKLPTPYLLGPIMGITLCNIFHLQGPEVPSFFLCMAQFSMGAFLGLLLKPERFPNNLKTVSLYLLNGIILLLFSLGLSYILAITHGITFLTAMLCMAPGGADQMSLIASAMSADVSMVTGYQLFRILFIYSIIPPVLKWFINRKFNNIGI